jgi:hypothetical protein
MRIKCFGLVALSFCAGCFGSNTPPPNDDAGYGQGADLAGACSGNNDGVIARSELVFPTGLAVHYLSNPPGTTVMVSPDGTAMSGSTAWDLTSTAGEVLDFTLQPISGMWFASQFPGATYVTTADVQSGLLGVFRVTDTSLDILGFASPQPNQTLFVYDSPIQSLRFPVQLGDSWVTGGHIINGKLNGQPYAANDTYKITVDARGTAVLPYLKFDNTMRVHVEISQALPGGVTVTRIQDLFFHECYGELGRMVSNPGETNPSFTTAAEFRRLAL